MGAGAGAGAGAGIGGGSGWNSGGVIPDKPPSTSSSKKPDVRRGYLVNIPFYYRGAGATGEVDAAISNIWKLIRDNSTFKTGRDFKVLIGLNRKKDAFQAIIFIKLMKLCV